MGNEVQCLTCNTRFQTLYGIPDLRVSGELWFDVEADLATARSLAKAAKAGAGFEELVGRLFAGRQGFERYAALRTRQLLDARDRLRNDLHGWLRPWVGPDGVSVLDLGCGAGTLCAAAALDGREVLGLDASMAWLVVARKAIEASGGTPVLAAGLVEALPLANASVSAVVALDVLEHVAQPAQAAREIDRVLAPGGTVALTTPNRFSLAPETHTGLWGVGWLPRFLQIAYVKRRTGLTYAARNLSANEAVRLFADNTNLHVQATVGPVPIEELRTFGARRAALARFYNRLVRVPRLHPLLLAFGPFCRIVGRKPQQARAPLSKQVP